MASDKSKRDIADFFRPYAKPNPPKTVPAKRPSPTSNDELDGRTIFAGRQVNQAEPRTPLTASRFKGAVCSPYKSPFGPRSGASVTIPIRSPKPSPYQTPSKTLTPGPATSQHGRLFARTEDGTSQEKGSLSFADIPTSARSIVKNGQVVAVRGSDEEDSDSLCSLDDILGSNRGDATTGSSSPPDAKEDDLETERVRSLSIFTHGRSNALVGRDKLRELTSKANDLNFDISLLVGDHFDDEEIEANVAKAKQGYKASDDQERLKGQGLFDKKLLASVAGGEEGSGDMQRLFNAVERIDALAIDHTWSMFGSSPVPASSPSPYPFPSNAEETDLWLASLNDPTLRQRAYLSGYVAEKVADGAVPDSLVAFTFDNIVKEPRDDLKESYVEVVKAASQSWTRKNLGPSLIEQAFCQLGADSVIVKCANDINPEPSASAKDSTVLCQHLLPLIRTLKCLATDLIPEALSKFVKLLMRLAIDNHLMSNSGTCIVVEDAISSLLDHSEEIVSLSAAQCILEDVGLRVKAPYLQIQVLKHILPISPIAASLRIQLANLFLQGALDEDTIIFTPTAPGISLGDLTTHLDDPRYDISRSNRQDTPFDYGTLSCSIYIFDAALANGGRPSAFPDTSSEREFNNNIDILVGRIKSIMISIADTGASHMRRTEAKEALNALHFRLLYGVRTMPRPKKSVFGGRDGDEYRAEERSKSMMQHFLKKRKTEQKGLPGRDTNWMAGQDLPGSSSQKSEFEELNRRQLRLQS
ncbi:hypothetical protein EPUS_05526 [Endocarpon pusillum Z07020]|uniref:Uncharacterized protein n=1 Tax=Endocarpon pusillum (strain Z07020 / HMAS-L-300199) TaxID=1263415 RepID=U1G8N8_ENDPU|nr:uncharacterized protein EPUS_05526 [Endocarpon pusillum Z07020]ERF73822.1 hypothetical protein EPUS_05526 [Endocarpon pusillum Z07020]